MIESVLEFWFGVEFESGFPLDPEQEDLWFRASMEHDWQIYRRFHHQLEQALAGRLNAWATTPRGRLALILLLDQFTRHLYRHTPWAYRGDETALRLCREALASGEERDLLGCQRLFLYAPLEHCEDLETQELAVANIERLRRELPTARWDYFAQWIRYHRDVIRQFGRFPWRNRVLGRVNTAAECDYLQQNPPNLGQW